MNLGDEAKECEVDGKLLIVSGGTVDAHNGNKVIPARSCAWFIA